MAKEIDISNVQSYLKALHCHLRWDLIEILKEGPKSSDEIFTELTDPNFHQSEKNEQCENQCTHENLKKHSLYYHLRELEKVGIIELDAYKPSEENRAPEKVWRLNYDKLIIKFRD